MKPFPINFVVCAVLAGGIVVSAAAIGDPREQDEIWFQLYSSPRGAPLTEMRQRIRSGPFPDVVICYAVGALDALDAVREDRAYRGRCGDGDLLTFREMTDRAIALLPKPKTNGEK